MSGKMYVLDPNGSLSAVSESPFENEDLFQGLLERYPDLLAGEQMDSDEPRRWLLVDREVGVPDEEEAANRWSLDHLFLDQDGIPTLVEVKRSSDTRIRREVVGQMLDYAANAAVYWSMETIRARFEAGCELRQDDPANVIRDLVLTAADAGDPVEAFWERVKTNLQAGRIRLVFVADQIPAELRRIVEFLNGQMDPAEVLAVQIRHFAGQGLRTLVPQVFGHIAAAEQKKGSSRGPKRQWTREEIVADISSRHGNGVAQITLRLMEWVDATFSRVWYGEGKQDGSFVPVLERADGDAFYFFSLWTNGFIEVSFQYLKQRSPFDDEIVRRELLARLNAIPGVTLPESKIGMRPSFRIANLESESAFKAFCDAIEWGIARARKG